MLWRFKYRFYGQERALSFGEYLEVTLKMAREKRDEAGAMLAEGFDPLADKQQKVLLASIAAATTVSVVADEFIEKMARENKALATIKKARWWRNELRFGWTATGRGHHTPRASLEPLRVGELHELPRSPSIVRIVPTEVAVRPVDHTVAKIAAANGGRYSVDLHLRHGPAASETFAQTHVRRGSGVADREPDAAGSLRPTTSLASKPTRASWSSKSRYMN